MGWQQDVGPVFYAGWPGICDCGTDFDDGDELRYVDGVLLAEGCCGHEYADESADGLHFYP